MVRLRPQHTAKVTNKLPPGQHPRKNNRMGQPAPTCSIQTTQSTCRSLLASRQRSLLVYGQSTDALQWLRIADACLANTS